MGEDSKGTERVTFSRGYDVCIMAIDGTWRRDCQLNAISDTDATLTVEGSIQGLNLKEFFLLLSSTGLAFRRCQMVRVAGDQIWLGWSGGMVGPGSGIVGGSGTAIPISVVSAAGANTVFVDAKLNLTVKPHVTNEGSIVMNVNITRNEPDFVNVGARGDPTILKKQAKTEMLVRDGDTAVIGGIYTRNTGLSWKKVPFLAEIPIVGWAFKTRREADERTEMLIFITPRIVNRARAMGQ